MADARIAGPLLAALLAAGAPLAANAQPAVSLRLDPERVVGVEACGECHVTAYEVWKGTHHATGFRTLHRLPAAAEIAERMGFKLIKRDSLCLDCHYTAKFREDELRAISGVSCESCHGAARDWINVHNDFGGQGIDHRTETPEHRAQRIAASRAAGMRRGSDLYAVASSCFGCHTVPVERLVNVGRHSLGSADFELAAWTEGEIRHNFLASFLDGDGTENAVRPPEHRRRVYVLGRALALEHSLRGVAAATEQGVFLKAMEGRLRRAVSELRLVSRLGELPEVEEMLAAARQSRAGLGHGAELRAAADQVGASARSFLDRHDGTRLAALDPLVEGRYDEIADLLDEEEPEEELDAGSGAVADAGAATAVAGSATPAATAGGAAGTAPAAGAVERPGVPAEGDKRSHVRPRSSHQTLVATACQKCHGDQHAWWYGDRHYASIEPFLDRAAKVLKIARLYGISTSRLTRGDTLCMDCHGTVATARASREVQDGVSCQSCHGPAADFLEPHQQGDKALGAQRPGYRKALQLGMVELRDLETRVRNCASCHYVTDPRLISAGHPTGVDFDLAKGMGEVRHWQDPVAAATALQASWGAVLAERGPVPEVRRARLATVRAPAGSGAAANGAAGASGGEAAAGRRRSTPRILPPRPARRRGAGGAATTGGGVEGGEGERLPAFPDFDPTTPIEDLLYFLKERLELLYRAAPPHRPAPVRPPAGDVPEGSR